LIGKIKEVFLDKKYEWNHNRSTLWPKVREEHLKQNGTCAVCSSTELLEVHHIKPFHNNPELELEPSNLITLCESKKHGVNCHLFFGHCGNYKLNNPDVISDASGWNEKFNKARE
jgi:5-methylcytosine-specific restriction endonuclease McrA